MKNQNVIRSELICSECGAVMPIPRKMNQLREKNHVKDLYCYQCDKVTKFIEIRNLDILRKELEFKTILTREEQKLYDILFNESEENEICLKKTI